uniref:F-box domain-containing protein n=1 Tax=Mycena chlorophos TaxID=658473 RepID=A0ABQ0L4Q2_MYCCL|nr:predicted protein [Mycena chlorophos]
MVHPALLMDEILVEIFALVMAPDDHGCLVAIRRTILSSVCRPWKRSLDGAPSLWSHIVLSTDLRRHYINRLFTTHDHAFKSVKMDLISPPPFHIRPSRPDFGTRDPKEVMSHIAPHLRAQADTIHLLDIHVAHYDDWNYLVHLLGNTFFPAAVSMSIQIWDHHLKSTPLPFPTRPRNLILKRAALACFELASYAGLCTLTLGTTVFLSREHAVAALNLLAEASQLRSLYLEYNDAFEVVCLRPVELPHLELLSICCNHAIPHPGSCSTFASYIHTPHLATLCLHSGASSMRAWVAVADKMRQVQTLTLNCVDFHQLINAPVHHIRRTSLDEYRRLIAKHVGHSESELSTLISLPNLRSLEIRDTIENYDSFIGLVCMLEKVLRNPALERLRIPHSFTVNSPQEGAVRRALLLDILASSGRRTPTDLIEEHARCNLLAHQGCRRRFRHICGAASVSHEICAPYVYEAAPCVVNSALGWRCSDTAHSVCASVWRFDGEGLTRGAGQSVTAPSHCIPVGAASFNCTFMWDCSEF